MHGDVVIHVSIYAHIIRHNLWDTSLMHHRYLIEIHTNTFKYMYPPDTVGGCIRPIFGGKRNHPPGGGPQNAVLAFQHP